MYVLCTRTICNAFDCFARNFGVMHRSMKAKQQPIVDIFSKRAELYPSARKGHPDLLVCFVSTTIIAMELIGCGL